MMATRIRRRRGAFGAILFAAAATGCSTVERVGAAINPDSVGIAERCAALVKTAIPGSVVGIDKSTAENTGIRTNVAHVEGTRRDLREPAGVGADCTFQDGILTGFHWTKGGPQS